MPEVQLQGSPINVTWSPSYYPWKNGYEGFQYRDDLSWTKGRHQFKFGGGWLHTYKNQELQYNTNGVTTFNSSNFSGDSYINFVLGIRLPTTPSLSIWPANTGSTTTTAAMPTTTGISHRGWFSTSDCAMTDCRMPSSAMTSSRTLFRQFYDRHWAIR